MPPLAPVTIATCPERSSSDSIEGGNGGSADEAAGTSAPLARPGSHREAGLARGRMVRLLVYLDGYAGTVQGGDDGPAAHAPTDDYDTFHLLRHELIFARM